MSGPPDPAAALLADMRTRSENAEWSGLLVRVKPATVLAIVAIAEAALRRPWMMHDSDGKAYSCHVCGRDQEIVGVGHFDGCGMRALDAALDALAKLSSRDDAAER